MLKAIKSEIPIDYELKKKFELICEFNTTTIYYGSIRKIDKSNLTYIEPYRVIDDDTFDNLIIKKQRMVKKEMILNDNYTKIILGFVKQKSQFID